MSRRDQAHQRVLQTWSIRSTIAPYKDACRLLGRLRDLVVACSATDHYHPCSNLGVGIYERVFHLWLRFITFGCHSAHLSYHVHKSSRNTNHHHHHHRKSGGKWGQNSCRKPQIETTRRATLDWRKWGGPGKKWSDRPKSTCGTETFSDNKRVVARWSEHFQKLLNVLGRIEQETLDNTQQPSTNTCLG